MVNIELLKRLRTRFLRMRHPRHFNMEIIATRTDCGTAMCIAGHALDLAGYKRRAGKREDWSSVLTVDFFTPQGRKVKNPLSAARRELGLPYHVSHALFHDWKLTTPKQAADRIRELIDEVNQPKRAR